MDVEVGRGGIVGLWDCGRLCSTYPEIFELGALRAVRIRYHLSIESMWLDLYADMAILVRP